MASNGGGWFEVDRKGLADVAKRRGMAFIVTEPVQNAWDEDVKEVSIDMNPVVGKAQVQLTVRDDSPDGFRDLADSYMMFRQSYKLGNPEQRGRFNIGEKLLLAVAVNARVTSTTGSVIFDRGGRRTGRKRTDTGSVLTATLKMTRLELDEAIMFAHTLIPPPGIRTLVNGVALPEREPLREGSDFLETEIRGEEGGFSYTRRKTLVRVYPVLDGEEAHLYEMGIPVDTLACPWHVEVMQKIPLSIDRSSVRQGFVHDVEQRAAELMADQMDEEQARGGWVSKALEFMHDDEAVRSIVKTRFGKAVVYDPSAPESNKLALDAGYKVVHGGELTKWAWQAVKRVGALKPAGQVFDDGRVQLSPDGIPPVPFDKWSRHMRKVAEYAGAFAQHTLDHGMEVVFYDNGKLDFAAFCGSGCIALNMGRQSVRSAVDGRDQQRIDELLIHECAHDKVSDHLTHAYHHECCRIGARARSLGVTL